MNNTAVSESSNELNGLISRWAKGDDSCEQQLYELIYPEIHLIAKKQFKLKGSQTFQTTELAHEAYIRLKGSSRNWKNLTHFKAVTALIVQQVLIAEHRSRNANKRGGLYQHLTVSHLEEENHQANEDRIECFLLSELIEDLKEVDSNAAAVVIYKFYGGLNIAEISDVLKTSESTVSRLWKFAKLWLHARLN